MAKTTSKFAQLDKELESTFGDPADGTEDESDDYASASGSGSGSESEFEDDEPTVATIDWSKVVTVQSTDTRPKKISPKISANADMKVLVVPDDAVPHIVDAPVSGSRVLVTGKTGAGALVKGVLVAPEPTTDPDKIRFRILSDAEVKKMTDGYLKAAEIDKVTPYKIDDIAAAMEAATKANSDEPLLKVPGGSAVAALPGYELPYVNVPVAKKPKKPKPAKPPAKPPASPKKRKAPAAPAAPAPTEPPAEPAAKRAKPPAKPAKPAAAAAADVMVTLSVTVPASRAAAVAEALARG